MGYSFFICRPQSGSLACNGVAFTAFTGRMVGHSSQARVPTFGRDRPQRYGRVTGDPTGAGLFNFPDWDFWTGIASERPVNRRGCGLALLLSVTS